MQVIGKHDHDGRGRNADQESHLRDVDTPGNVPAQAGDRKTPVPLSEVSRETKPHKDEQDPKQLVVSCGSSKCSLKHFPPLVSFKFRVFSFEQLRTEN